MLDDDVVGKVVEIVNDFCSNGFIFCFKIMLRMFNIGLFFDENISNKCSKNMIEQKNIVRFLSFFLSFEILLLFL